MKRPSSQEDTYPFVKGTRVLPSGQGRTATWPPLPGTVTRRLGRRSVEVIWDGTHFGDEMDVGELRLLEEEKA